MQHVGRVCAVRTFIWFYSLEWPETGLFDPDAMIALWSDLTIDAKT